jgi:hypothetical protein
MRLSNIFDFDYDFSNFKTESQLSKDALKELMDVFKLINRLYFYKNI